MKRLLIGCMEILFLKLGTTIFGLDWLRASPPQNSKQLLHLKIE
jgi:hypothetical protein